MDLRVNPHPRGREIDGGCGSQGRGPLPLEGPPDGTKEVPGGPEKTLRLCLRLRPRPTIQQTRQGFVEAFRDVPNPDEVEGSYLLSGLPAAGFDNGILGVV